MKSAYALALGFVVAAAGCGGNSSDPSSSTPNFSYIVDVTSQETNLTTLGNGKVAGWNRLTGTTTINGESAEVEVLANVAYRDGSGPFFGFVHTTFADGSIVTMRMEGTAVHDAATGNTAMTSSLTVFGGTMRYVNATGGGSFKSTRSAALGGVVHMDVRATVN